MDFQLGLRPIKPDQWILVDSGHAAVMDEKRERLRAHAQLFYRATRGSHAAQAELRERVVAHLLAVHGAYFERTGSILKSRLTGIECDVSDRNEPLLQLSHLIEEDFMLLEEVAGVLQITAAANAYSSSGRLVSSVGREIEWAHQYVPNLTLKLGPKINRVLSAVHTSTPCERFNWQLTPMATVFFPHDAHAANAAAMRAVCESLHRDPERAGGMLWIRVERQTLTRLPQTQAVAFSLHTYSDPLSSLESDPDSLRSILALLRAYSPERWQYSEMDIIREPILAWLERRCG